MSYEQEARLREVMLHHAIGVLNRGIELDADAMHALFKCRVPCNALLASHESIQVRAIKEVVDGQEMVVGHDVGVLGLINGLFGTRPDGYGFITAECYEPEPGVFIVRRFVLTDSVRSEGSAR